MDKNNEKRKKKIESNCETCLYYDYDDDYGDNICTVSLDEDEAVAFLNDRHASCRYYKNYDEYKSVRRQN